MHVNRVFAAGGKGLDYRQRAQFTEQAIGFLRRRLQQRGEDVAVAPMRHRGGEQCVLDARPLRRGQRVVGDVHRSERKQRRFAPRGLENAELFGRIP